jgi:hypothetical protein
MTHHSRGSSDPYEEGGEGTVSITEMLTQPHFTSCSLLHAFNLTSPSSQILSRVSSTFHQPDTIPRNHPTLTGPKNGTIRGQAMGEFLDSPSARITG